jgi:hypothetical protein
VLRRDRPDEFGTASGVFSSIDPTDTDMSISRTFSNNIERCTVLELDNNAVPLDATVDSAAPSFRVLRYVHRGVAVEVYAHAGDRTLEPADATRADNFVATTLPSRASNRLLAPTPR